MGNDLPRHCSARPLVHEAPLKDLLTTEERRGRRSVGPHVYRFYAEDREALYIGVTCGTALRWADHRRSSPWWSEARYVAVSFYGTYEQAMVAEAAAIKAERPCFNRQWITPRKQTVIQFGDGAEAIAAELHKIASPEFVGELARLLASPEQFPQPLPPPVPAFPQP
ncbi:GIY-YIG nuclease family protein [Streptomyces sp. NPDC102437]|uniref:GIY-YIG nuclease family protein n=1 Tax=Streptomyces sp. NPDC102437 TaxID=3366175 RepID=UPI00380A28AA